MNAIAPQTQQETRRACKECRHGEPMFPGSVDSTLWRCFQSGADESAMKMRTTGACGREGKLWEAQCA